MKRISSLKVNIISYHFFIGDFNFFSILPLVFVTFFISLKLHLNLILIERSKFLKAEGKLVETLAINETKRQKNKEINTKL